MPSAIFSFRHASLLALALGCATPMILAAESINQKAPAKEVKKKAAPVIIGRFEAKELARIEFKPKELRSSCKVARLLAKDGPISSGSPILQLSCEDGEIAKKTADRALEQARLGLQSAENANVFTRRQAALTLADAETRLVRTKLACSQFTEIDKPSAITSAKAKMKSQEAGLEDAKTELAQLRKMYEGSKIEGETRALVLKRAERRLAMAEISMGLAKIRHEQTLSIGLPQKEQDLNSARAKAELALQSTRASLKLQTKKVQLALGNARQAFAKSEKKHAELLADLAALNLNAPATGTLIGLAIKQGADCAPGLLARIVDLRHGKISWDMPLKQASKYAPGSKIALEVPELGLKLEGTISRISLTGKSAAANGTTLRATIEIESTQDLLPGLAIRILPKANLDQD